MKQVYRVGTKIHEMLMDGWCRDLKPQQTTDEINANGFPIDLDSVKANFELFDKQFMGELEDIDNVKASESNITDTESEILYPLSHKLNNLFEEEFGDE